MEANDATATPRPSYSPITLINSLRTPASEPDTPGENTFVLSQTIASTPSSPTARKASTSTPSPICGSGSIFQSPVCKISPAGVRITNAFGSGMEWVKVISSILNGPSSNRPLRGILCSGTSPSNPASDSRPSVRYIVKGVA